MPGSCKESDVYLLFLTEGTGTYLLSEDPTVTHLEFDQAYVLNKRIFVFGIRITVWKIPYRSQYYFFGD
jgi:hypothetical protein